MMLKWKQPERAKHTIVGVWLGEHLWSCIACCTRNPSTDAFCTNCPKGERPPTQAPSR